MCNGLVWFEILFEIIKYNNIYNRMSNRFLSADDTNDNLHDGTLSVNLARITCSSISASSINATSFDGSGITNVNAVSVNISTDDNTNDLLYPTFTNASGTTQTLKINNNFHELSYNPSTQTLYCSVVNADLVGNTSGIHTGDVLAVSGELLNYNTPIAFVSPNYLEHSPILYDNDFTYNPTTQTLTSVKINSEFIANPNGNLILNSAGGNVGIGTITPSYKLDVHSGASEYPIKFRNNTDNSGWLFRILADNKFSIHQESVGDRMIFDNGNVGIGTLNPLSKLHVEGDICHPRESWVWFSNQHTPIMMLTGNTEYIKLGIN
jgi:hypothetical protein